MISTREHNLPPLGVERRRQIFRLTVIGSIMVVLAVLLFLNLPKSTQALPERQPVLVSAALGLDEIAITAELHPDTGKLVAEQKMRIQNRSGLALEDIVLRTYANAFSSEDYSPAAIEDVYDQCYPRGFSPGGINFSKILLSGQPAAYTFDDAAKTVLRLSVPSEWQAGDFAEITLAYEIQIPDCAYRFGQASGIYTLGNSFPILSIWENGAWRTDEYFPLGDPFYSNCANYNVTVTVPRGYQCAGSAWGEKTEADGKWTYTFDAPAVRDFALSISNTFAVAQETVDDVLVSSFAQTEKQARDALKYGKQALACYNSLYGQYPYQHFAITMLDFPFGGMEYPGLVLIQKTQYDTGNERNLETVIAHEAAHQWWYAVVGSDQYNQPWQDEAMADYALLDYYERYYGKEERDSLAFSRFETAMRVTIPRGVTPGSPIDYFDSMSEYSLVVYRRGAALLVALHQSLGDTYYDFLRTYYRNEAFRIATRQDFENTLKSVSGQDWSALIVDYLDTYIVN